MVFYGLSYLSSIYIFYPRESRGRSRNFRDFYFIYFFYDFYVFYIYLFILSFIPYNRVAIWFYRGFFMPFSILPFIRKLPRVRSRGRNSFYWRIVFFRMFFAESGGWDLWEFLESRGCSAR